MVSSKAYVSLAAWDVASATDDSPGWVNPEFEQNPAGHEHVLTGVDPIREVHLSEPGLLVVDVAGADEASVMAFRDAVVRTWATAPAEHVTREPGRPGVRIRLYTDLRQALAGPMDVAESGMQ
jgi:hypothetical protein